MGSRFGCSTGSRPSIDPAAVVVRDLVSHMLGTEGGRGVDPRSASLGADQLLNSGRDGVNGRCYILRRPATPLRVWSGQRRLGAGNGTVRASWPCPNGPTRGAGRFDAGEGVGEYEGQGLQDPPRLVPGYQRADVLTAGFLCSGAKNPMRGIVYADLEWKHQTRRLPWRSTAARWMVGTAVTKPAIVCRALSRRSWRAAGLYSCCLFFVPRGRTLEVWRM
jgi:hypothetical protein